MIDKEALVAGREPAERHPGADRADAFSRLADLHLASSYRLATLILEPY